MALDEALRQAIEEKAIVDDNLHDIEQELTALKENLRKELPQANPDTDWDNEANLFIQLMEWVKQSKTTTRGEFISWMFEKMEQDPTMEKELFEKQYLHPFFEEKLLVLLLYFEHKNHVQEQE